MKFILKSIVGTVTVIITVIVLGGVLFACGANASRSANEPPATSAGKAAPVPAKTGSVPVEYQTALKKAQSYADIMHMSKRGIYNQLTSTAEKFPKAAAQYAVDNVKVDYKSNALAKAKSYREIMSMSTAAIRSQLTSSSEGFTAAEADYAVANLSK
ncbi:MAG: Ltp family lipoprotein [Austwickia sp.]|nr:Ltp family lipoprotein [Austwickia sp.]MBK8436991.1 Ltp family lipoprotein [Austwickia sp.]MBK9100618.1 Ltp family lipoprotein [Austwickia sp.]